MLVGIIHLHRHGTLNRNCLLSLIFHSDCPGNYIQVIEDPVQKVNLKVRDSVVQCNLQSLCFFFITEHAGKALK